MEQNNLVPIVCKQESLDPKHARRNRVQRIRNGEKGLIRINHRGRHLCDKIQVEHVEQTIKQLIQVCSYHSFGPRKQDGRYGYVQTHREHIRDQK